MNRIKEFLDLPCTVGDTILIALLIGWLGAIIAGVGAEHNAKEYADRLFRSLR